MGAKPMLQGLEWLARKLRFDPAKTTLSWWLAASQVAIVLLVAGGISLYSIGMLRVLADEQGKARVQLGGAMAREDLRRFVEDAVTSARVLADRPTLNRLLSEQRPKAVGPFLRRFCAPADIDACAVFDGPNLVATAGPDLPWNDILAASAEQGEGFLSVPAQSPAPLLGAFAKINDRSTARVFIVRFMNDALSKTLSRHTGLEVRLVNYRAYTAAAVDDFTSLHSAGLADGRSAVQRISAQGLYASSFPVFASTGEAIALIETRLPAAEIDNSATRLIRRLLITAGVLAVLAVVAGVLLGQYVAGPVQQLTGAALRLGQGDFSTSIPTGGAAEVGALARTMEDMRRNLVDLTSALRRREAEAQAVLAGIVEGVYAVDKNRIIRYLNPQAARLLGVEASEAVGRFCGDVLKPRLENGRRPCETACPIMHARIEGTSKAVERLQVDEHADRTTIITSSNVVDGIQVQVIRDETELEAVRRARDSVLANISHEFRTPLAAQLASIELLREGLATMEPTKLEELVLSLERGTQRLTRLIDNLLESVRIEAGQLGIRKQSVELREVVEEARALIGSLLVLRRQTLDIDLPEDLPLISGDRLRLGQVFVNLIANASKFAPEGSTVYVGARAEGENVISWVEDEGPGVSHQDSAGIFDRFRRGAGEEPEPGGLGLGLWIVKSIIDRHGGAISVERVAERTRFSITLPADLGV
jgi:signal transduction histidine kinase